MITKDNYIEYIVDYFDGNLSTAEKQELFSFLKKHHEFYDDFLEYGDSLSTTIEIGNINFDKTNLIKTENDEFEKLCIDYIEGKITQTQIKKIAGNDPDKNKTLELFQRTKISAENIIFPDKNKLLKRNYRAIYYPVAAILILLFALPFIITKQSAEYRYSSRTNIYAKLKQAHQKSNTIKQIKTAEFQVQKHEEKTFKGKSPVKKIAANKKTEDIPLQKIKQHAVNKLQNNKFTEPEKLLAKRNVPKYNLDYLKVEEPKLKNIDFIGKKIIKNKNLEVKIKDNRLSYFALNTKQFYLKVH